MDKHIASLRKWFFLFLLRNTNGYVPRTEKLKNFCVVVFNLITADMIEWLTLCFIFGRSHIWTAGQLLGRPCYGFSHSIQVSQNTSIREVMTTLKSCVIHYWQILPFHLYTYIHTSAFQSIHKCAIGTGYKTCQTTVKRQSQIKLQRHQFNHS
jgi:hypothetical protein